MNKDFRNISITFARNVRHKAPCLITLKQTVEAIKQNTYQAVTTRYRALMKQATPEAEKEAKALKSNLPVVVFGARFEGGLSEDKMTSLTGLMMFDVDHIHPELMSVAKEILKGDDCVVLIHDSVSGGGFHFVIAVELDPDDPKGHFRMYWDCLSSRFSKLIHHPVDLQCKNFNRSSFLCYDPEVYFNPDATPISLPLSEAYTEPAPTEPVVKSSDAGKSKGGRPRGEMDAAFIIDRVVSRVEAGGVVFRAGEHNRFISSCAYEANRAGLAEAVTEEALTARYGREYSPADIRSCVHSAYSTRLAEHGSKRESYVKASKRGGGKKKKKKQPSRRELYDTLLTMCEMRLNTVLGTVEVRLLPAADAADAEPGKPASRFSRLRPAVLPGCRSLGDFQPLNNQMVNTLLCRLESVHGQNITAQRLLEAVQSEHTPIYDPVLAYYESLPEWDGVDRLEELFSCFSLKFLDDARVRDVVYFGFRSFFIGLIPCSLGYGDDVNDCVLSLIGDAGLGKTQFLQRLLPPELQPFFGTVTRRSLEDKDTRISMTENVLLLFDECSALSSGNYSVFNDYVSKKEVKERRPYDRIVDLMARRASFCVTANHASFLSTAESTRRFITLHLEGSVDFGRLNRVDKVQLFAQLLALWDAGEEHHLQGEQVEVISAYNFEHSDILERNLLLRRFRRPEPQEQPQWLSREELFAILSEKHTFKLDMTMLDEVLRRLELPTRREGGVTLFGVVSGGDGARVA
jgi:hypothetical protein